MAFGPQNIKMSGEFQERDYKQYFQYCPADPTDNPPWPEYIQKIWIQPDYFLWGKVLKTVAYVCSDENADGSPYVDKWYIQKHYEYS